MYENCLVVENIYHQFYRNTLVIMTANLDYDCRYGIRIHIDSAFDSEVTSSKILKFSISIFLCLLIRQMIWTKFILRWWIMYNSGAGSSNVITDLLKVFANFFSSSYVIATTWAMALSLALSPLIGWSYYEPESSGLRYIWFISISL